jgi:hypothetical protein
MAFRHILAQATKEQENLLGPFFLMAFYLAVQNNQEEKF